MILSLVLFGLMSPQFGTASVPATVPDPDYPLHIELSQTKLSPTPAGRSWVGRGNILGTSPAGFDYLSSCYSQPAYNTSFRNENDYYQARWKEQGLKLEILLQEPGERYPLRCELKVTVRAQPYELFNSSGRALVSFGERFIPVTTPIAGYPLRIQLEVRSMQAGSNGYHREGRGNVLGPPDAGFEFTDSCEQQISPIRTPDEFYQARWKQKDMKIEILVHEIGSTKIVPCELKVALAPVPYSLFSSSVASSAAAVVPMPASPLNPDYPLHIQLQVTNGGGDARVEGRGNILGPPDIGFNFIDTCNQRPVLRDPHWFYQARWKEQDLKLEVLFQEMGSNKITRCEFKVSIVAEPYTLFPTPRVRAVEPPVAPPPVVPTEPTPQNVR